MLSDTRLWSPGPGRPSRPSSTSSPGPSVHISLVPVPGHPHKPGTGRPPVGPRPAHPDAHDGPSSSPWLPQGHPGTRGDCAGLDPAPTSLCACHVIPSGLASTLCRNLSRHTSFRNHYCFRNSSCRCQHVVSSLPGALRLPTLPEVDTAALPTPARSLLLGPMCPVPPADPPSGF